MKIYLNQMAPNQKWLGVLSNCVWFESLSHVPNVGWVAFSAWMLEHSVALSSFPSFVPFLTLPPPSFPFLPLFLYFFFTFLSFFLK